jgi:hypothetical protein
MKNYVITCRSGVHALVKATDAQAANEQWDAEAETGNAEPRIPGLTRRANRGDVVACVASGHDYRT